MKASFLKYFIFPVFFLLVFQGIGRGEVRVTEKIPIKTDIVSNFGAKIQANVDNILAAFPIDETHLFYQKLIGRSDEIHEAILNNVGDIGLRSADDLTVFFDDIAASGADLMEAFATNPNLVKSWDVLRRNGRELRNEIDALGSLNTLLGNTNLVNKLPGKTPIEIEDLLAKMKGWGDGASGASYSQVADKVNELIDELPSSATNFDKYLGSAGFGNGNVYTNRHSWVQLERLLEPSNKSFINAADEIVFENPVSSSFGNSVSDMTIFKNGRRIEVETKAGLEFFEGVSGSNFPTQSANSLLNVDNVADYKVFLNPEKIAILSNADKLSVVNSWKGHTGDFLGNEQIRQLFADYWDDIPFIESGLELENLLKNRNDWFDDIFKNNIE